MTHLSGVGFTWCKFIFQSFSALAGLSGRVKQNNLVSVARVIVMVPKLIKGNTSAKSLTVQDLPILSLKKHKF